MGEVYRARDTTLDRDVALKVLPEAFTSDPDRLARFEREAKVLASLNHPNIGHIYGLKKPKPRAGRSERWFSSSSRGRRSRIASRRGRSLSTTPMKSRNASPAAASTTAPTSVHPSLE